MKLDRRAKNWILFLSMVVFSSCGEDFGCSGNSTSSGGEPANTLKYEPHEYHLWATLPMTPSTPTGNFATVPRYAVAPTLPPGIDIDAQTGTISGTPTDAFPRTPFTISAMFGNEVLAIDSVTIEVFPAIAPGTLTYTPSSMVVPQNSALPLMQASYNGAAESFSVVPSLPPGLDVRLIDGTISGICGGQVGVTQHTVTVSNPFGAAQTDIQIEVTDALTFNGIVVASGGDGTLDMFVQRDAGVAAIDAEYCGGDLPLDVAATPDGKLIYTLTTNGKLLVVERDPLTGYCDAPVLLDQLPFASKLTVTPDNRFLLVALSLVVKRYEIQPDGSLCCDAQTVGPFHATSILASTPQRLLVGASLPGEVWCYDIEPVFTLRGPVSLGPDMNVNQIVNTAPGTHVVAITSTYVPAQGLLGNLRELKLSTDAEMAAGAAAVVETANHPQGKDLSDGCLDLSSGFAKLLVCDASLARVYEYHLDSVGAIMISTLNSTLIGGTPSKILRGGTYLDTFVLDAIQAEIVQFEPSYPTPLVRVRLRTRNSPVAMVALNGPLPMARADTAFVTSATDSTLLAVRSDKVTSGLLTVSPQGPVATGAAPADVVASQAGPYVYTADRLGGTISAFHFDTATLQLTLVETESLPPGSQPIALSITPGGSHLYALDGGGSVISMSIDPTDGSLIQTGSQSIAGSMIEASLRMDVLARFLFVVQPATGTITSMRLTLPGGAPTTTSQASAFSEPIDLLPALDGRFVSVVDRELHRIGEFQIDALSGDLTATGATLSSGTAPNRLIWRDPVPTIENAGTEYLSLLDPNMNVANSIGRNQLLGSLQASNSEAVLVVSATERLQSLSFIGPGFGFIGASDDVAGARLTAYKHDSIAQTYAESDFKPIGAGPHALATLSRRFAP